MATAGSSSSHNRKLVIGLIVAVIVIAFVFTYAMSEWGGGHSKSPVQGQTR
jgi:ABC-type cobalt transport system substrate-binding protein